jgi:hypothetical protein
VRTLLNSRPTASPPLPVSRDLARRTFNDHPDYELYYASGSLTVPAVTLVLSVVSLSLWCLIRACTFNGLEDLGFLQISFYPWGLTPLVLAFCIFYGILFSFLVATIGSKKRRKGEGPSLLVRSLPVIKILCLTGAALVMFAFGVSGPYPGWPPLAWLVCTSFALCLLQPVTGIQELTSPKYNRLLSSWHILEFGMPLHYLQQLAKPCNYIFILVE